MSQGNHLHHIHKRKRANSQKLKAYPHPNKWINFLDKFLVVVACITPMVTIPQIYSIYWLHQAAGVSAVTWFLFCVGNIPWLLYGIVHKAKPIVLSSIIWFVVNLTVAIGAAIY
jgi:uncharacterized protein with PQ loop repeat